MMKKMLIAIAACMMVMNYGTVQAEKDVKVFIKAIDSNNTQGVMDAFNEVRRRNETDMEVRKRILHYYEVMHGEYQTPVAQAQMKRKTKSLQALKDLGFKMSRGAEDLLRPMSATKK